MRTDAETACASWPAGHARTCVLAASPGKYPTASSYADAVTWSLPTCSPRVGSDRQGHLTLDRDRSRMHQHPDAHPAATGAAAGARAPAAHGSTGDILDADTAQAFNAAVRTAFELGEGTVSFGIRPGHASVVSPLCEVRLEGCWLGEVDGFAVSGAHGRAVGADRTVAGLELWAARSTVGEHRRVVEGITYRFRTGIPWRDQPRDHLPRRSYALAASSPGFGYWKMHPNRNRRLTRPGVSGGDSGFHDISHLATKVCRSIAS